MTTSLGLVSQSPNQKFLMQVHCKSHILTIRTTSKMQVFLFKVMHSRSTSLRSSTHTLKADSKSEGWVKELTLLSYVLSSEQALAYNKTQTAMSSVTSLISPTVTSSSAFLLLAPAWAHVQDSQQPRLFGSLYCSSFKHLHKNTSVQWILHVINYN